MTTLAICSSLMFGGTLPRELTPIQRGDSSGITEAQAIICKDKKSWSLLWLAHRSNTFIRDRDPMPTVNFFDDVVVGIFIGDKPTTGWTVDIVSVVEANGDTTITYEIGEPGSIVGLAYTQSHLIVSLKRPKGKLTVVRKGLTPDLVEPFDTGTTQKTQAPSQSNGTDDAHNASNPACDPYAILREHAALLGVLAGVLITMLGVAFWRSVNHRG